MPTTNTLSLPYFEIEALKELSSTLDSLSNLAAVHPDHIKSIHVVREEILDTMHTTVSNIHAAMKPKQQSPHTALLPLDVDHSKKLPNCL